MRTPNNVHTRSPPRLYTLHRIFEHQTFLPLNQLPSGLSHSSVDALQRERVDVGARLVSPWCNAWIIAEDYVLGLERREERLQMRCLQLELIASRAGGEGKVDGSVMAQLLE